MSGDWADPFQTSTRFSGTAKPPPYVHSDQLHYPWASSHPPPADVSEALAGSGGDVSLEGSNFVDSSGSEMSVRPRNSYSSRERELKTRGRAGSSPPVPSTAVYVKNLTSRTTTNDIEDIFQPFAAEGTQVLIVPYFDRGVAFVDLGSTAAVAAAVKAARTEGLRVGGEFGSLLTVEPSKKPVRASGLRAMNVRKRTEPTHQPPHQHPAHSAPLPLPAQRPALAPRQTSAVSSATTPRSPASSPSSSSTSSANRGAANGGGLGRSGCGSCSSVDASSSFSRGGGGGGGRRSGAKACGGGSSLPYGLGSGSPLPPPPPPLTPQQQHDGLLGSAVCWVVRETCQTEMSHSPQGQGRGASSDGPTLQSRVVGVFSQKEHAVTAANALWLNLKSLAGPGSLAYAYSDMSEDSANGNFLRRLDLGPGLGSELRQVTVEAPAVLNPCGEALRECTSAFIDNEPALEHVLRTTQPRELTPGWTAANAAPAAAAAPEAPYQPPPQHPRQQEEQAARQEYETLQLRQEQRQEQPQQQQYQEQQLAHHMASLGLSSEGLGLDLATTAMPASGWVRNRM